jgi:tape measure domain-containing protein
MSTLDKLKDALNFTGASKGLEKLSSSVENVGMFTLGKGIDSVRAKFSALQVVGMTALTNITNSVVDAGKKMVSALTVEPLKAGFSEYETKINSIQTIMSNTASKGTTMKDVTRVIDDLNTYADKTIYNFAEMTRNIGTFTAAGVGLEESASAIKGIANLAAASGSSSQQASTAMYQLSQALSTGTVRLTDWNSVVSAGMGGEKFQEALKATAREHGVAIDSIIEKSGSFRDSLQEEWLSAEILNETLNKFTVDGAKKYADSMMKSGKWTQEQADALMKEAQSMEDAATKVKTFTQLVDTLKESLQSGWAKTWEILVGDFEEAKALFTEISDTLSGVIGKSADSRNELLQSWKDMGGRELIIDALRNSFEALTRIVTPIKEAFREVFPPTTAEQLMKLSEGIKNLTEKFKISSDTAANLKQTFKGVFSFFAIIVNIVKSVAKGFVDLIKNFSGVKIGILDATAAIGKWITKLKDAIENGNIFGKAIDKIVGILSPAITKVKEFGSSLKGSSNASWFDTLASGFKKAWSVIQPVADKILGVMSSIGGNLVEVLSSPNLGNIVASGTLTGVLIFISGIFKDIKGSFEGITETLDSILGCLEAYQANLKANALKNIAIAVALLAGSLLVISMINPDRLGKAVAAMGIMFAELMGALAILNKLTLKTRGFIKTTIMMVGMSVAILILASAMKKIGSLDLKSIAKGVFGIGALMVELAVFSSLIGGIKNVIGTAAGLVILSSAMLIFANVMTEIGSLSWESIAKGLASIGALLAEFIIFTKLIGNGSIMSAGVSMVLIGAAMKILANAMADFGKMNLKSIGKALLAMGGALAVLAIALRLIPKSDIISIGFGLVILGGAMKILANAMAEFGKMDLKSIGKALLAMGGALAELAIALRIMPNDTISLGLGLVVVGGALKIIANAMGDFSGMSWGEVVKGLVAMGGALAILAISLRLMQGAVSGALALIITAGALAILAPVLNTLGKMSWGAIAKSLLVLAGAFTVIGLAGYILGPVVPVILALGQSILMLGAGVAVAGAGLVLCGIGLTALATGLVALVSVLSASVSSIVTAIKIIVTGFAELIPIILENIGEGIVQLIKIIGDYGPDIYKSLLKLIFGAFSALAEYVPQMVEQVALLLLGVIEGLTIYLPELIVAAVDLIGALLKGIVEAINGLDTDNLLKGILSLGVLSVLTYILSGIASLIPAAMLGVLGLAGLVVELGLLLAAIGGLKQIPGVTWIIDEGGALLETIGVAIGKFFGGLAGGVLGGMTNSLPQVGSNLSGFMNNAKDFIEGAKALDASMLEGTKALCEIIMMLTAANIVDSVASWLTGGDTLSQFADQLIPFGEGMRAYGNAVSGIDPTVITASATAAKSLAELALNLPNSGGVVSWFSGDNDMDKFGEMLAVFGAGMKAYSDEIAGVDPTVVTASATAAKSLAELALNLPNTGGVVSWFTGDNDIDTFGTMLKKFGKGMKAYSDEIKGIDPNAITASATAGKSLVELANNLPNTGGVVSWFTGDNDLDTFGTMLKTFGKGMKEYGDEIKNIDPTVITASVTAAKSLSELSNNLPNTGGVVSWFTGDNDLDTFGDMLKTFGKGMKDYATEIEGIDPTVVTASATAAKSLSELANNLPNTGGVVSWFTGDNDIDTFGTMLATFGKGMKSYADEIEGIDAEAVTASATAAKSLSELSNNLPNTGGVVSWFTGNNDLDTFGDMLVVFGKGMKSYADAVSGINANAVTASATAGKSLVELANNLPNTGGVVSWFTGNNDLDTFGDMLVVFGKGMKSYGEAIKGMDTNAVAASATAGKSLAELANNLPNTGGVVSWFTGNNDLDTFGEMLKTFGKGMKEYGDAVSGIDSEAVSASATAALSLAELANNLPNTGGFVSWFTGNNDLDTFGEMLVAFGKGMKAYGDSIKGIDADAVSASATAAKSLASLAHDLPNTGGVVSWFSGDNDMDVFGEMLTVFGKGMKSYGDSIKGMDADAVTASATAAKSLVKLANELPNTGGVVSWFTGDNDLDAFSEMIVVFGKGMKGYSDAIKGVDANAMTASANVASTLAELSSTLPNTGGVVSWFTGDNDIETFGDMLVKFGKGIKEYSDSVNGMNTQAVNTSIEAISSLIEIGKTHADEGEAFDWLVADMTELKPALLMLGDAVKGFANAVKGVDANAITSAKPAIEAIIELEKTLNGTGGIKQKLTGEKDLGDLAEQLVPLGKSIKQFSDSVTGIDTEAVTASATAAKSLTELINSIKSVSSIFSIFGESDSMDSFGSKLVSFGRYMKLYSVAISGMDTTLVANSATAGKALWELMNSLKSTTSVFSIFGFGESESIDSFGGKLVSFGRYMKLYSAAISGIDTALITNSTTAGKALCELVGSLKSTTSVFSIFTGVDSVDSFGENLVSLAGYIKKYSIAIQGFSNDNIDNSITITKKLIGLIKDMVGLSSGAATTFKNAINAIAEANVSDFIDAFNVQEADVAKLGENIVNMLIDGIESKASLIRDTSKDIVSNMVSQLSDSSKNFKSTGTNLMKAFVDGIISSVIYVRIAIITPVTSMLSVLTGYYSSFYSVGSYLVSGFANGISDNAYKAAAKTRAMAEAAKQAAEEALGIQSPSKVFYGIGRFTALGFTNAINDNMGSVYDSTSEMAENARNGMTSAIGKISDIINSDIDAEPTIRPVLDLSDVESGSRLINGMFNNRLAIGATADVGTISSMMNNTIQNGGNDDVISAIDKLRDSLGSIGGNTYNVNGVTYDDGSNVSNAVKSLVRAARIERRV